MRAATKQYLAASDFDIIFGIVGSVFTILIAIIVGPIIYIKSKGPIFFVQERVGKNGKKYTYVRAYYGSHLLDTEEMSRLLSGTVEEMKHMGIPLPPTREMQELLRNELPNNR